MATGSRGYRQYLRRGGEYTSLLENSSNRIFKTIGNQGIVTGSMIIPTSPCRESHMERVDRVGSKV